MTEPFPASTQLLAGHCRLCGEPIALGSSYSLESRLGRVVPVCAECVTAVKTADRPTVPAVTVAEWFARRIRATEHGEQPRSKEAELEDLARNVLADEVLSDQPLRRACLALVWAIDHGRPLSVITKALDRIDEVLPQAAHADIRQVTGPGQGGTWKEQEGSTNAIAWVLKVGAALVVGVLLWWLL